MVSVQYRDYVRFGESGKSRFGIMKCLCMCANILLIGIVLCGIYVYVQHRTAPHFPDPPPHEEVAKVARYVIHVSEWASLSTFSTQKGIEGYPFANIFSMADGPVGNSTGVPYFYITAWGVTAKDLEVDNRSSVTVSEAQSEYCMERGFDPEDPRCAHVVLTGRIVWLAPNSTEEKLAKDFLFSRHSEMEMWPADHQWFFAKLDVLHVYVLDYFGGSVPVTPEEYFAANPYE